MEKFRGIEARLKKYNQDHILKFYNDLEDDEKTIFTKQIQSVDFERMNLLYKNSMTDEEISLNDISPIEYVSKEELTDFEKEKYTKVGMKAIIKNQLSIVTLAGRTRK